MDFITIVDDGEHITTPMPPDETVVEVKLTDGRITRAWYSCNIMDAGDWDFLPVLPEAEPDRCAATNDLPGRLQELRDYIAATKAAGAVTAGR